MYEPKNVMFKIILLDGIGYNWYGGGYALNCKRLEYGPFLMRRRESAYSACDTIFAIRRVRAYCMNVYVTQEMH